MNRIMYSKTKTEKLIILRIIEFYLHFLLQLSLQLKRPLVVTAAKEKCKRALPKTSISSRSNHRVFAKFRHPFSINYITVIWQGGPCVRICNKGEQRQAVPFSHLAGIDLALLNLPTQCLSCCLQKYIRERRPYQVINRMFFSSIG